MSCNCSFCRLGRHRRARQGLRVAQSTSGAPQENPTRLADVTRRRAGLAGVAGQPRNATVRATAPEPGTHGSGSNNNTNCPVEGNERTRRRGREKRRKGSGNEDCRRQGRRRREADGRSKRRTRGREQVRGSSGGSQVGARPEKKYDDAEQQRQRGSNDDLRATGRTHTTRPLRPLRRAGLVRSRLANSPAASRRRPLLRPAGTARRLGCETSFSASRSRNVHSSGSDVSVLRGASER
ncbi:hypothetical protein BDY21DRAFT_178535 [Lineolata rhizophorae]|uniref:Uncharacterized protein n=1 Tax=Lineolata rhizophorae TaxID=578093 RepID=A0A6A6P7P2_9PEZI|nr:hypothetical protein BDY21DRAFT_178535 [Lineolata rhizophorae]